MTELEQHVGYGWAAGFFDGDGCIRIKKGRDDGDFHLRLDVTQTDPIVLRDFVIAVGVPAAVKKKKGQYYWPMFQVTYASNKAKIVIERLVRYSVAKRAELDLALEFCEECQIGCRDWSRVPAEIIALRAKYAYDLAALKRDYSHTFDPADDPDDGPDDDPAEDGID